MTSQLTILNSMASADFQESVQVHREWGLHWMDLRDEIFGKWVGDLTYDDGLRANEIIRKGRLEVFCLSTSVFFEDIASGEAVFRDQHLNRLRRILAVAAVFKPRYVRLIAAQLPERPFGPGSVDYVRERYPWLADVYREGIDLITDAGFSATIENEARRCFLSATDDIVRFFDWIDRPDASLTWDINNQWATGVFPTLDDYEKLRPLIHYYHLKGGRVGDDGDRLAWNSALEDSSFPVVEITQRVVDDGVSPVICLNPSQHGQNEPGYDYSDLTKRDIDFLRANVKGIE